MRGRPFAGPAGELLKFEPRGKRRIHKMPSQAEAAACQHWLEEESAIVQPQGWWPWARPPRVRCCTGTWR